MVRGTGKRIYAEERKQWNENVYVQFNEKAWATSQHVHTWVDELSNYKRVKQAKAAGLPSLLICDNLESQTSAAFFDLLYEKAYCFVHLLPTGCTSELQHIDSGLGSAVKSEMLREADSWAMEGDNIERLGQGQVFLLHIHQCVKIIL